MFRFFAHQLKQPILLGDVVAVGLGVYGYKKLNKEIDKVLENGSVTLKKGSILEKQAKQTLQENSEKVDPQIRRKP